MSLRRNSDSDDDLHLLARVAGKSGLNISYIPAPSLGNLEDYSSLYDSSDEIKLGKRRSESEIGQVRYPLYATDMLKAADVLENIEDITHTVREAMIYAYTLHVYKSPPTARNRPIAPETYTDYGSVVKIYGLAGNTRPPKLEAHIVRKGLVIHEIVILVPTTIHAIKYELNNKYRRQRNTIYRFILNAASRLLLEPTE